jgi:hypothetical protein
MDMAVKWAIGNGAQQGRVRLSKYEVCQGENLDKAACSSGDPRSRVHAPFRVQLHMYNVTNVWPRPELETHWTIEIMH